jgi:uncharacterized protein (TIGR03435 family)
MRKELVVSAILCVTAFAQQPASQPSFLAADVHEHAVSSNARSYGGTLRGERFELHNVSLLDMVYIAWAPDGDKIIGQPVWLTNDRMDKVKGGPEWLDTDHFDIIAKAPAGSDKDAVKAMLRSLLAQRFGVTVHPDQRPVPAYVLSAGPRVRMKQVADSDDGGCKLKPHDDPSVPPWMGAVAYTCHGITMAKFAEGLWRMADDHFGSPIADKTGLNGAWDFDVSWTPRMYITGAGSNGVSIAQALDKQLGLKLETRDTMVPVFVVDKANRKPTANVADIEKLLPALPDKFEVATLKPTDPDTKGFRFMIPPGGRFEVSGAPLQVLISQAWDVPSDLMADGPKWLTSDRYDIIAKAPEGFVSPSQALTIEEVRPMLRALLIERFGIKVHRETRDAPVYALVRSGKAEPKMTKSQSSDLAGCVQATGATAVAPNSRLTSVWTCRNISMSLFATRIRDMAPAYIGHYTVDATGIEGNWDFTIAWTPNGGAHTAPADEPDDSMTVFEALEKQLGLKLDEQKRPAPVLVIDHIDQKPADN